MSMIPWKRYVSPTVGVLIAATVVLTLIAAVDLRSGGRLAFAMALIPDRVMQGEVWRLATWVFVTLGPLQLLVHCVGLYVLGGDLAARWGQRKLGEYVATIVLTSALATTMASQVWLGMGWFPHFGIFAFDCALVIAWALTFPERRLYLFYGMLVVGGPTLAYGTFAFVVLCTVFFGLVPTLPWLIAAGMALWLMRPPR